MALRTDNGDRLEVLRPGGEGDIKIAIEFADETPILMRSGSPEQVVTMLTLRPSQAERLIDELRLVLGPRPETPGVAAAMDRVFDRAERMEGR
jgi:hypothetical protein